MEVDEHAGPSRPAACHRLSSPALPRVPVHGARAPTVDGCVAAYVRLMDGGCVARNVSRRPAGFEETAIVDASTSLGVGSWAATSTWIPGRVCVQPPCQTWASCQTSEVETAAPIWKPQLDTDIAVGHQTHLVSKVDGRSLVCLLRASNHQTRHQFVNNGLL